MHNISFLTLIGWVLHTQSVLKQFSEFSEIIKDEMIFSNRNDADMLQLCNKTGS